ncbi:MAG TPA: tetratricopeptide repeat protein, partial [Sphingobacterium sp.]|nr:tetratricopeptide repeat protein [Sphingobacterium sp.]
YRGKLYAGIKDLKRAEKDLDYCIAKDPSNKVFREDRALFYERNGFRDKAIADYSCLIELDPDDFFPYVVRADLYKETDQVTLALADYDKAIALNPYYSDLYQYRAELRERLGDPLGARLDLQKYEELEDE